MSVTPIEPSARATYNLGINASQLGIGRHADKFSIKNVYIDVDDTHIKVVPFDFTDDVDDNGSVLALPATTIGSAYQIQFYAAGKMLLSAYFEMPERDCFLADLKLYTAMPAREHYPEGAPGKSAYQSAIDTGVFEGTEEQWAQWQKPTINDVDLLADIKVINDVTTLPAGVTVPRRIGSDVYSLSTFNDRLLGVDKVLTQTGGTVDIGGVPVKTIKQATDDALNIATAPIYDFIDAGKDELVSRPLGAPFKSLNHYLEYLDGVESVFTQPSGSVTVNGIARKSLQQAMLEVNTATALANQVAVNATSQVDAAINEAAISNSIIPTADLIKLVASNGKVARNQKSKNDDSVTPYDFGAIGGGLERKLSERYATLAQAQEQYPSAKSLDDTIDLVALESFFAYCKTHRVNATVNIKAYVNRSLDILGTSVSTYTGALDLINLSETTEIDWLLQINCWGFTFNGRISASGNHNVAAKNRKQLGGILIGERTGGSEGTANTVTVDYIEVQGFRDFGVHNIDHSMFLNCNSISASYIGSMGRFDTPNGNHNQLTTITERVLDYKNNFNDQYSELRVAELPPGDDPEYIFIAHGEEIYQLKAIDRLNSTISVYPYLDPKDLSSDIGYIYGNATCVYGDDTNAGRINRVYSIVCGIGYNPSASYGFITEISSSESCGISILHGKSFNHIVSANTIEYAYFEDTTFHIVFASAVTRPSGLQILSTHGFEPSKIADVVNYRVSVWDDFRPAGNLPIYSVNINGVTHSNKSTQFSDRNLTGSGDKVRFIQLDGGTLELTLDWDVFERFGYRTFTLILSPTDVDVTISTSLVGVTLVNESNTGFVVRASKRPQVVMVTPVSGFTGKYLYIGLEGSHSIGGATASRPTGATVLTGHQYFDTTLNKLIVWSGTAWVDAMGVAV